MSVILYGTCSLWLNSRIVCRRRKIVAQRKNWLPYYDLFCNYYQYQSLPQLTTRCKQVSITVTRKVHSHMYHQLNLGVDTAEFSNTPTLTLFFFKYNINVGLYKNDIQFNIPPIKYAPVNIYFAVYF